MANWDVFHSDRLEVERGLTTAEVRAGIASGSVTDDDLIRPAGTSTPWGRIGDMPALLEAEPTPTVPVVPPPHAPAAPEPPEQAAPVTPHSSFFEEAEFPVIDDEEVVELEDEASSDSKTLKTGWGDTYGELDLRLPAQPHDAESQTDDGPDSDSFEMVTWDDELDEEEYDPQEEDEEAAEFTLARGSGEKVEELDLAAMVDVAFQLVLFFLVTATTVLYKSLEVPKPNPESAPNAAATQGKSKSLEDLKDSFILVEIDPAGAVKIDREAVAGDLAAMTERLRSARERTGRNSMLLSADFATPHKSAVLAYDAANEIGLGIAIARPSADSSPPQPPAAPPAATTPTAP